MNEEYNNEPIETPSESTSEVYMTPSVSLSGLYEDWFLDYASYVVLERAVPDMRDGLKPVQRRILHSMKEMDDGRYNKVANIIGNTMKYHPHGDKSIGDALVQMGQKDLLIDTQGNWGNVLTGDSAAAPRYIEARLSKFALEVMFNAKTTQWNLSYDGRNKEPDVLPVKFPLLLAMGIEGIAVGMASKILPHNFIELIDASVHYLRKEDFELYPDFQTGGMADVSRYNDGIRGGKVRLRAKIQKIDNKTLVINEIPATVNTGSLIDSIIAANDKGKIKIRKIEDNTAENVEIMIHLGSNVSPDQTIDALYAFTACEESISPNSTVIYNGKPVFLGMKEILRISTNHTVELLKLELEIRKGELQEKWHYSSLEKIFIKERIYRQIEEATSFEQAIEIIDKALDPYKPLFKREITHEDIEKLTEIRIKRISKYNEFKADEIIKAIEDEIAEVEHHLAHLIDFAIAYFLDIKAKYGKGKERKTELRNFDNIVAASVAVNNVKLYVNKEEGFVGTGLRKDEFVADCSDLDDLIAIREDGTFIVTKVTEKVFIGKNILHVAILKRNDDRTIYNMVYRDGKNGANFVKRFAVTSITRDKVYDLTKGTEESKILYLTANPNGEAEVIRVKFRPRPKLKKLYQDFDFSELAIKGRSAAGNTLTKNVISKIELKRDGVSTLGAIDIYYDSTVKRLNTDGRGHHLGAFVADDTLLNIRSNGYFKTTSFDLSTHFDDDLLELHKFNPELIWTAIYEDGETKLYYLKRFKFTLSEKPNSFIGEHPDSKLVLLTHVMKPNFEVIFDPESAPKNRDSEVVKAFEFIDEKSFKAKGKRLSTYAVSKVVSLDPDLDDTLIEVDVEEIEGVSDVVVDLDELKHTGTARSIVDAEEDLSDDVDAPEFELADLSEKPLAKPIPINVEDRPMPTLLPVDEIAEIERPAKKVVRKKTVKEVKPSQNLKVSLDSDEPLQMELDL